MLELGGDADFAVETGGAQLEDPFCFRRLDGDLGVVAVFVLWQLDGGHSALAELAEDAVAGGQEAGGGRQRWRRVRRGAGRRREPMNMAAGVDRPDMATAPSGQAEVRGTR